MFVQLLKRFFSSNPSSDPIAEPSKPSDTFVFSDVVRAGEGHFFADYTLYLHERAVPVDILFFLPRRGLYYGEKIPWTLDDVKEATLSRATARRKQDASTRFDSVESAIRRKIADVVSFDSTPLTRFIWMENLTQEEYGSLDPSFHELLPRSRIVFADDTPDDALSKLEALCEEADEPYSALRTIGSLNAHRLLLPTPKEPFGAFLSDEQNLFLDTPFENTFTTLYGASGSGKSTLLLRRAVAEVLRNRGCVVLIVTPTSLAGELLRDKWISLMEYGAFTLPLDSIRFCTPEEFDGAGESAENAKIIMCDDTDRMSEPFLEKLKETRGERWLLFSTMSEPDTLENTFFLLNRYRYSDSVAILNATAAQALFLLLSELRRRLLDTEAQEVMVVLPRPEMLIEYKKAIDEYLGLNCRMLQPGFSLQYQNLDNLLLATPDMISGIRIPHLYLVSSAETSDCTFELSRASDTATIILVSNSDARSI
ncbi:MAG: ATP-binding protein [Campylobacterota bacterium]